MSRFCAFQGNPKGAVNIAIAKFLDLNDPTLERELICDRNKSIQKTTTSKRIPRFYTILLNTRLFLQALKRANNSSRESIGNCSIN